MKPIISLLLFVWSATTYGASVCPDLGQTDQSQNPIDAFDDLINNKVLGDTACNTDLCNQITQWGNQEPSLVTTETAGDLLESIRDNAATLPDAQPGVTELQTKLSEWQVLMAEAEIGFLPTAEWQPARFILFDGDPEEINFEDIFLANCPNSISECSAMFETATCVYTHAVLQRRILRQLLKESRDTTIAYLHRLNLRWTAYNSGGRGLFPWELWANGELYRRKTNGRGFVEPPNKQIAILHPSIAFAYEDTADGELDEALILELLGWYRWSWGGKSGAAIKRPFGASIIASWDGSSDVGYGVMIHMPKNWSIGVTRRSVAGNDETSVLVSMDLGKFLLEEQKLRTRLIDKISLVHD